MSTLRVLSRVSVVGARSARVGYGYDRVRIPGLCPRASCRALSGTAARLGLERRDRAFQNYTPGEGNDRPIQGHGAYDILFCGSDHFAAIVLDCLIKNPGVWKTLRVIGPPSSQSAKAHAGSSHTNPVIHLAEATGLSWAETPPEGIEDGYEFPPPMDLDGLRRSSLDPMLVTASFGHFIPPQLLRNFSAHGRGRTLNVHPSFLPKLRSGAPIPWSIVRNRNHPSFPVPDAFNGGHSPPLESWVQAAKSGYGTGKSEIPAYGVTVQELSPDGFDEGAVLYQEALAGGDSLVRITSFPNPVIEEGRGEDQHLEGQVRWDRLGRAREHILQGVQTRVKLPPSLSPDGPGESPYMPCTATKGGESVTSYERWTYRSALLALANLGGRALVGTLRDLPGYVARSVGQTEIAQRTGCLPTNAFKRKDLELHLDFAKHDAVHIEALFRAWGFHHQACTTLYTAELVNPLERKGAARKNPVPPVKSVPFSIAEVDVVRAHEMDDEVICALQEARMFTDPKMYTFGPPPKVSKDCVNVTRIRPAEPGDMICVPHIAPSTTVPRTILPLAQVNPEDPRQWVPKAVELQAVSAEEAKAAMAQQAEVVNARREAEEQQLSAELAREKERNAELDAILGKFDAVLEKAQQDGTKTTEELQALKADIKKLKAAPGMRRKKEREERARPALVIKCAPEPGLQEGGDMGEAFLVVRQYRLGDGRKWRSVTSDTWNGLWERADELNRLNLRSKEPDLYAALLKQREEEQERRMRDRARLKSQKAKATSKAGTAARGGSPISGRTHCHGADDK